MAYLKIWKKNSLLYTAFICLMVVWFSLLNSQQNTYIENTLGALNMAQASKEYFVSLSGNDSNAGTINAPFLSLSYAAQQAGPGDTIWIRGDNFKGHSYAGKITITGRNGTNNSPILIKAYNNEKPIYEYIKVQNSSWIDIEGITVIGPKTLPEELKKIDHIYADDNSVGIILGQESASTRQQKCSVKFPTYLNTVNYWLNNWSAGISIHNSSNIIVANNDVSYHSAGVQVRDASIDVTVKNNELHNNMNGIYTWKNTGDAFSSSNMQVIDNHIFYNLKFGIFLMRFAQGTKIEDNLIEYNALTHIGINNGSNNSYVLNNRLRFGGYYSECMDYPGASAISVADGGADNVIDSNIISDQIDYSANDGNGIIADYTPFGITAINNVVFDNMGSGFSSTNSGNNVVINNTFANNGYGSSAPRYGIRMHSASDINNIIANNIIYKNAKGGILLNNGLISKQTYVDYNLYFQPGTPLMLGSSVDTNQQYSDFSTYKEGVAKNLGIDQNSINADPLFTNESQKNFSVLDSSPAINKGTNSYTTINKRTISNVTDIGAIEHVGSSNSGEDNPPDENNNGGGAQVVVCIGDYNDDKFVDEADYKVLAQNYKKEDISCSLDIANDDCFLNIIDLVVFAEKYNSGVTCNI
ncbi:right-handed parallel beta-helix repeat-containing protein [Candidatus Dojkabacteria bacterium]|uniref:Right-handed parallel beta-helix repeat-containing protein n=1 Tax=Candidatus Dojkabacteria bacterium TaxID=2099670 RepID=A0A955LAE5_9BACT|nr:right-handed parallel beta-helix repeat-containing protein [Candidatus Dojkabacteria bacterium]